MSLKNMVIQVSPMTQRRERYIQCASRSGRRPRSPLLKQTNKTLSLGDYQALFRFQNQAPCICVGQHYNESNTILSLSRCSLHSALQNKIKVLGKTFYSVPLCKPNQHNPTIDLFLKSIILYHRRSFILNVKFHSK